MPLTESPSHGLLGSPESPLTFWLTGPGRAGQFLRLNTNKCLIGSDRRCQLRLQSRRLFPTHCTVLHGPQGCFVRRWSPDTRLNGEEFEIAPLASGDVLSVGPYDLLFGSLDNNTTRGRSAESSAVVPQAASDSQIAPHIQTALTSAGRRFDQIAQQIVGLCEKVNALEEVVQDLAEPTSHPQPVDQTSTVKGLDTRLGEIRGELDAELQRLFSRLEGVENFLHAESERSSIVQADNCDQPSEAETWKEPLSELGQEVRELTVRLAELESVISSNTVGSNDSPDAVPAALPRHSAERYTGDLPDVEPSWARETAGSEPCTPETPNEEYDPLSRLEALRTMLHGGNEDAEAAENSWGWDGQRGDALPDGDAQDVTTVSEDSPADEEFANGGWYSDADPAADSPENYGETADQNYDSPDDDDDESINKYMESLLHRTRGYSGGSDDQQVSAARTSGAPAPADDVSAATQCVRKAPSALPGTGEQSAVAHESETSDPGADPNSDRSEKKRIRSVAPERSEHMNAMRELANLSAIQAIKVSSARRGFRAAAQNLLYASGFFAVTIGLGSMLNGVWAYVGMCVSGAVAVSFVIRGVILWKRTKSGNHKLAKPGTIPVRRHQQAESISA